MLEIFDLKTWFPIRRGILSRNAGYVRAVDGVTFKIEKGETLGLVGESGCGKSTLGRTLVGLEKAREGRILFSGRNLKNLSQREFNLLRKRIQMIFQDPVSSLNPRMNVLSIITEGLENFRMIKGNREDHAKKLLAEVGLSDEALYRYPHEFSGGQRQRINIARAISLRPDFVICDEPVSALDASVQAQVINLLLYLQTKLKLSYLFISHDLSVVSNIANTIAVMYLGKILEYGPAGNIISNPMHPYTRALISAALIPGRKRRKRIILKGEAPSPITPPSGCRFHPRCPNAMKICKRVEPEESQQNNRTVFCHLL